MSPPEAVQASPVATPARDVRRATSGMTFGGPRYLLRFAGSMTTLLGLALGVAGGVLAADGRYLALEVAHARLAGVARDDGAQAELR